MKNQIGNIIKTSFPKFYQELIFRKEGRYSYDFDRRKYPDSFLAHSSPKISKSTSKVPEQIFCFWTGENEMSENRKRGLASLEQVSEVEVILITPKNLENYILPEFPLHPSYELLSLVHRSDYLRCYFMHHHGGGYADVKSFHHSWKNAFTRIQKKNDKFILGYPEVGGIAPVGGKLYEDLKFHIPLLIGNGAYICRSNTEFTSEWYQELNRRMDDFTAQLKAFDEKKISEYAVPYTYLLGQIFHPLSLKYHQHILQDKKLMPEFKNYH